MVADLGYLTVFTNFFNSMFTIEGYTGGDSVFSLDPLAKLLSYTFKQT